MKGKQMHTPEIGLMSQIHQYWSCGFGCYFISMERNVLIFKMCSLDEMFCKDSFNPAKLLFYILLCGHRQHGFFVEGMGKNSRGKTNAIFKNLLISYV